MSKCYTPNITQASISWALKTSQEWMKVKECCPAFCNDWKNHAWRQSHQLDTFLNLDINCFQLTSVFMQGSDVLLCDEIAGTSSRSLWESKQRIWSRQDYLYIWKMIGEIHIVTGSFHVYYVQRGTLGRLMCTEVCIRVDIAHFPSLMYGFNRQQVIVTGILKISIKRLRDLGMSERA